MEALRQDGNAHFAASPAKAAELYAQAMALYESTPDSAECSLEEYTKCAGNALTCLYKLERREECVAVARRALAHNPIFAKANAFIGRCGSDAPALLAFSVNTPLLYLCRSVYLLPAMEEAARPYLEVELDRLVAARREAAAASSQEPSALVEVRHGSCGNGVVATAPIDAFTCVSDMSAPFSVASYEETEGRGLCANCGRSIAHADHAALPHCRTCRRVYYCCSKCADAHQASQHDPFECAKLLRLQDVLAMVEERHLDVPDAFFEVAAHTISTLAAFQAKRPGWRGLAALESHGHEVSVCLHPTAQLVQSLYSDTPTLSTDWITEVIGVVRCNALEVPEEESGMGIGQALYCGADTLTSFFNHSCSPNCAIDSARHGIVTTRAVRAGEDLCISYMPQLYWPRTLRRNNLSEHFFFSCRCSRCLGDGEDPFERAVQMELPSGARTDGGAATTALHVKTQSLCAEVRGLPVDDITASHVNAVRALQAELSKHLPPFHYLQHELRNLLSFLHAVRGDTAQCLDSCLHELLMWESIVPGALPVKCMKLRNALECMSDAAAAGTAAPKAALYPHVLKLALAYGVAEME